MRTGGLIHYWALGMTRRGETRKLHDNLCGDIGSFTSTPEGVTCERCAGLLKAESAPPPATPPTFVRGALVAEQVRAAVLKEREECAELVKTMIVLAYPERSFIRSIVDEIRRRP